MESQNAAIRRVRGAAAVGGSVALEFLQLAQFVPSPTKPKNHGGVTFKAAHIASVGDVFSEKLLSRSYQEVEECNAVWVRLTGTATDAGVVELFAHEQISFSTPPILIAALAGTTECGEVVTYMADPLTGTIYWVCAHWSSWMSGWDLSAGEIGKLHRRSKHNRILGIYPQ